MEGDQSEDAFVPLESVDPITKSAATVGMEDPCSTWRSNLSLKQSAWLTPISVHVPLQRDHHNRAEDVLEPKY